MGLFDKLMGKKEDPAKVQQRIKEQEWIQQHNVIEDSWNREQEWSAKIIQLNQQISFVKNGILQADASGDRLNAQRLMGELNKLDNQKKQYEGYQKLLSTQVQNIDNMKMKQQLNQIITQTNKIVAEGLKQQEQDKNAILEAQELNELMKRDQMEIQMMLDMNNNVEDEISYEEQIMQFKKEQNQNIAFQFQNNNMYQQQQQVPLQQNYQQNAPVTNQQQAAPQQFNIDEQLKSFTH